MSSFDRRPLGTTDIMVTPVAMGCWPIAGITSIDVNDADSLATLNAAFDSGINFFDTAYGYGFNGESERLIARALGAHRDEIVLATKVGMRWENGERVFEATPARVRLEIDESLIRLQTDHVELLYLHFPDPNVPIEDTAGTMLEILKAGKTRAIGVSNATVEQLDAFRSVCPITACQPHYNMLQREIEDDVLPWCQQHDVSVVNYWPLMKGMLAGKLARDHVFDPKDGRGKYPMFQGDEWEKNQDFVDELRAIAKDVGKTVAQVVVNWTMNRPGITSVLCGAKRAYQIEESAGAMGWELAQIHLDRINDAIEKRGPVVTQSAVSKDR